MNKHKSAGLAAKSAAMDSDGVKTVAEPEQGEGPLRDGWQVSIGSGHAGRGVYAHMTEYPEEGAVLLCRAPEMLPDEPTQVMLSAVFKANPDASRDHVAQFTNDWKTAVAAHRTAGVQEVPRG